MKKCKRLVPIVHGCENVEKVCTVCGHSFGVTTFFGIASRTTKCACCRGKEKAEIIPPVEHPQPILLLDVDGVLNVIGPDCDKRLVRLKTRSGDFLSFFPTENAEKLIDLAWRLFDVRWLTAWRDSANLIAKWAGLPERPVLKAYEGNDWKATAVEKELGTWTGRVAWIEDGISPEAHEIVTKKGWTYFQTDSFVGVTEKDLQGLEEFAMKGGAAREA